MRRDTVLEQKSKKRSAGRSAVDMPRQLVLPTPRTWGGVRAGAGRPKGTRRFVPHRARPVHRPSYPLIVTMRAEAGLPSLRSFEAYPAVHAALAAASREDCRVVAFSVQDDHLHLVMEASDQVALSNGARALAIRVARAFNAAVGRRGRVFARRYHARGLRTPREVRHALVYTLQNVHKHQPRGYLRDLDPCSSARWFDGYAGVTPGVHDAPTRKPRTWLLRIGWRRHGLLRPTETPRPYVRDQRRNATKPGERARG